MLPITTKGNECGVLDTCNVSRLHVQEKIFVEGVQGGSMTRSIASACQYASFTVTGAP